MIHGRGATFSMQGVELCINYFKYKKHCNVTAFIPNYRRKCVNPSKKPPTTGFHLIEQLYEENFITFTPTRTFKDKTIIPYDDLILMYCFVGNLFMPAEDPLGRNGPKLKDFLLISNQELEAIKQQEEEYEKLSKDAQVCAEEPQHRAPALLSSLANLTVTEGEAIELSVDLSGHPPPSIQWSMERILTNDEKRCLSFDGRKARLTIQNCDPSDEAMYKIRLQNSLGDVLSTAQVNVHKRHQLTQEI